MSIHAVLDRVATESRQGGESIKHFDVIDASGRTIGVVKSGNQGDIAKLAVRLNWESGTTWLSGVDARIDWDRAVILLPLVVPG